MSKKWAKTRSVMQIQVRTTGMCTPVGWLRSAMVAMLLAILAMPGGAALAAPDASIVMDMRNGKVLYSQNADRRQHPASLTKMMTLYLAFEAVRDGRLRLDQRVRVSRHAAGQPASKLYLKSGQRVTIRSLIRATAIKSANDAAMVLAETIGGSQKAFARMMTRKARALGMKHSTFKNPHGLTARGHLSTARDMAILGRHLFFDFPQYYNIFKRRTEYAAGKRIWSTNRMLSTYEGADGIKTGYTRAAGYNLVASAHRGKKRVIGVVFGANSSKQRSQKMARLLDIGFSRAARTAKRVRPSTGRASTRQAKASPIPINRPRAPQTRMAALGEVIVPSAQAAIRPQGAGSVFAPRHADRPRARRGSGRHGAAKVVIDKGMPVPTPRPNTLAERRTTRRLASSSKRGASWAAEIGPYASEAAALTDLVRMTGTSLTGPGEAQFQITRGLDGNGAHRLQMAGLSQTRAEKICEAVPNAVKACNVVRTVWR